MVMFAVRTFASVMLAKLRFDWVADRRTSVETMTVLRPSELTFPITVKRPVSTLVPMPTLDRM